MALLVTPREEEPQIVVPVADVLISAPLGIVFALEASNRRLDAGVLVASLAAPARAPGDRWLL